MGVVYDLCAEVEGELRYVVHIDILIVVSVVGVAGRLEWNGRFAGLLV